MLRDYIPAEVERRVRQVAHHRCGYCLSPQRLVMARLEIEHIIPVAKGDSSSKSNLWLSCPLCNRFKKRAHWVLAVWHPPSDDEQRLSSESGNGAEGPRV
jgi:hypothetical protein